MNFSERERYQPFGIVFLKLWINWYSKNRRNQIEQISLDNNKSHSAFINIITRPPFPTDVLWFSQNLLPSTMKNTEEHFQFYFCVFHQAETPLKAGVVSPASLYPLECAWHGSIHEKRRRPMSRAKSRRTARARCTQRVHGCIATPPTTVYIKSLPKH